MSPEPTPGAAEGAAGATPVAHPETRGRNFYLCDRSLQGVLRLYLPEAEQAHLAPHLERLGALVGARLDDLAGAADRNPPVLHQRDRTGEDRQEIENHPAYEAMERLAFADHSPSGWSAPSPSSTASPGPGRIPRSSRARPPPGFTMRPRRFCWRRIPRRWTSRGERMPRA